MMTIILHKDHKTFFSGNRLARACVVFVGVVMILVSPSTGIFAQTQWMKYQGNPVLDAGNPAEWDGDAILEPWVIFDGTTYKMWYTGV